MDLSKEFGTDSNKEKDGIWVNLDEDAALLIARTGNPDYREALRKAMEPFKISVQNNTLPNATAEKILIDVMAKTILLDWKGIIDKGKELKYSEKNAVKLLTKLRDFRDFVSDSAGDMASYKAEAAAKEAENL